MSCWRYVHENGRRGELRHGKGSRIPWRHVVFDFETIPAKHPLLYTKLKDEAEMQRGSYATVPLSAEVSSTIKSPNSVTGGHYPVRRRHAPSWPQHWAHRHSARRPPSMSVAPSGGPIRHKAAQTTTRQLPSCSQTLQHKGSSQATYHCYCSEIQESQHPQFRQEVQL